MSATVTVHKGKINISPGEAGFNKEKIEALNSHYANLIDKGTIQGASYLLSRNGKIFAHHSLGKLRDTLDSPDIMPHSIRKTYSITKVFTAVAITKLIDQGILYLSQAVSSILPEFDTDMHRHITLFHLLTHTSGLRGDPGFYTEPFAFPWFEWAAREVSKQGHKLNWKQVILAGPMQNETGKEWIYSTSAFSILGEIISKASGKPYEQYIMDEIVKPLGLSHTFFQVPSELVDEVVATNSWEEKQIYSPNIDLEDTPPKAGNGLYSSLEDLWKFGQMMLNGGHLNGQRIISTRAVKLQTTNHLQDVAHNGWGNDEKNYPYGLGWSLEHFDLCSRGTFSHEGYGHCGLFIDPVEQLVFVFFVPSKQGFTVESVVTPRAIVWSGLT